MLKKQRKGFSLIELIVAIAILATMLLVLTPAALKYVDESRTAKDLKTTADLTEVVESSLADDTVYQEITKYIIGKYKDSKMNYSSYIDHSEAEVEEYKESLGEDSYTYGEKARRVDGVRYMVGGKMRGITITFPVTENKKIDYQNGRINEIQPGGIKGMANSIVLKDASPSMVEFIKNKFGKDIPITSATYRYSEFTIFIYTGPAVSFTETADSPMKVYGQWDGTNLIDVDRTVGTPDTEDVGGSGGNPSGGPGGSVGGGAGGNGYTNPIVTAGQTIPEGDIYVTNIVLKDCSTCKPGGYGPHCTCNAVVYEGGDKFPSSPQRYDLYVHGDYVYMYEQSYGGGGCPYSVVVDDISYVGFYDSQVNGVWAVGVKSKTQTSYNNDFVTTILGQPASNFNGVYDSCTRFSGTVRIPAHADVSIGINYAASYTNNENLIIEVPCTFTTIPTIHSFTGTVQKYHINGCNHNTSTINPVLEQNTWAEIQAVARDGNVANTGWNIGDTKTVTINGTTKTAVLIGINHDHGSGSRDTLTFAIIEGIGTAAMNNTATNVGGWGATTMREWLNTSVYNSMTDVKDYILPVYKDYNTARGGLSTETEKLFLLAAIEVGLENASIDGYSESAAATTSLREDGYLYDYFEDHQFTGGKWLRTGHFYYDNTFLTAKGTTLACYGATSSRPVAPAFVIG